VYTLQLMNSVALSMCVFVLFVCLLVCFFLLALNTTRTQAQERESAVTKDTQQQQSELDKEMVGLRGQAKVLQDRLGLQQRRNAELEQEKAAVQEEFRAQQAVQADLESQLQRAVQSQSNALLSMQSVLDERTTEVQALRASTRSAQQQEAAATALLADERDAYRSLQHRLHQLEAAITEKGALVDMLQSEMETMSSQLATMGTHHSGPELQHELPVTMDADTKRMLDANLDTILELRDDVKQLRQQNEQLEGELLAVATKHAQARQLAQSSTDDQVGLWLCSLRCCLLPLLACLARSFSSLLTSLCSLVFAFSTVLETLPHPCRSDVDAWPAQGAGSGR
jgi:chromosome segregation ATPase